MDNSASHLPIVLSYVQAGGLVFQLLWYMEVINRNLDRTLIKTTYDKVLQISCTTEVCK